MQSEVEICNLALAMLGDSATVSSIDPPEGSPHAEHCARFYPQARDFALAAHAWGFATTRKALALVEQENLTPWEFRYAVPADCIRILSLYPESAGSDIHDTRRYEMERGSNGKVTILTDTEDAVLRYICRVTDPLQYPPLFSEAMAALLASKLAGPVVKGDSGVSLARSKMQEFVTLLGQAKAMDSNQRSVDVSFVPSSVRARGG